MDLEDIVYNLKWALKEKAKDAIEFLDKELRTAKDEIVGEYKNSMAYFIGCDSENTVIFDDKALYNKIRQWAADCGFYERSGVLFANQEGNKIIPIRFVTENITDESSMSFVRNNAEEIKKQLLACKENVAILFHNHPLLAPATSQSGTDVANTRSRSEIGRLGINERRKSNNLGDIVVLAGIATAAHIGIYETVDDKKQTVNRLDVEVEGKRKHPLPFLLEFAESWCRAATLKIRKVYDSIQTMKNGQQQIDAEINKEDK